MRKLLTLLTLALPLWLGPASAQPAGPVPVACNNWAQGAIAAGTSLLITGVAGKAINVCGFVFSSTGTATAQLITGTGATCGTGTVTMSSVFNISANAAAGLMSPYVSYSTSQGNSLCVTVGTTTTNVMVIYGQF